MKKSSKRFFYSKELDSSSEENEDDWYSFSDPRVVGLKTMKQPRRGSTYVRPTNLNPYASAYLDQQHSDPGRFKIKGQQHLDPDQQIKTPWLSKLCCCIKDNSVKADYPNKSSAQVKLKNF